VDTKGDLRKVIKKGDILEGTTGIGQWEGQRCWIGRVTKVQKRKVYILILHDDYNVSIIGGEEDEEIDEVKRHFRIIPKLRAQLLYDTE